MSTPTSTIGAENATWDSFLSALRETLSMETSEVEGLEAVELATVCVTGSLATGDARPHESDADIIIGVTAPSLPAIYTDVLSRVETRESALCSALGLPVTGIHVLDVTEPDRASHRAMELQWQGNELARKHGTPTSPLRIYDAVHREFLDNARDAKLVSPADLPDRPGE